MIFAFMSIVNFYRYVRKICKLPDNLFVDRRILLRVYSHNKAGTGPNSQMLISAVLFNSYRKLFRASGNIQDVPWQGLKRWPPAGQPLWSSPLALKEFPMSAWLSSIDFTGLGDSLGSHDEFSWLRLPWHWRTQMMAGYLNVLVTMARSGFDADLKKKNHSFIEMRFPATYVRQRTHLLPIVVH